MRCPGLSGGESCTPHAVLYYSHMLHYPHAVLAEEVLVALLPGQGEAGLAHTALPETTTGQGGLA